MYENINKKKNNEWKIVVAIVVMSLLLLIISTSIIVVSFERAINPPSDDTKNTTNTVKYAPRATNTTSNDNSSYYVVSNSTVSNTTMAKNSDATNYNMQFEAYFGREVSGKRVKELVDLIIDNNQRAESDASLARIGIDPDFTSKDGTEFSGQNNYHIDSLKKVKENIDENQSYIVKVSSLSIAYTDDGKIQRITIADKSDLTDEEVNKFNDTFKDYYGKTLSGEEAKRFLQKVRKFDEEQYAAGTKRYIRVMFDIGSKYSADGTEHYVLTGISDLFFENGNYLSEYMSIFKENETYYVDTHEYRPDGTLYEIVVSDMTKASKYKNANR